MSKRSSLCWPRVTNPAWQRSRHAAAALPRAYSGFLILCGQVGYVALVRATARSFEQDTGRAPHKLSGSGARRKRNKLASSFHGVAAVLAIDSGVSPGSGLDLIIALRVQGRGRRRNAPRLRRAVRAARRWLCGVPVRKRAESRASNGWRPHNQLGHIRTENRRNGLDAETDLVRLSEEESQ
jgi:hypothetical protein